MSTVYICLFRNLVFVLIATYQHKHAAIASLSMIPIHGQSRALAGGHYNVIDVVDQSKEANTREVANTSMK